MQAGPGATGTLTKHCHCCAFPSFRKPQHSPHPGTQRLPSPWRVQHRCYSQSRRNFRQHRVHAAAQTAEPTTAASPSQEPPTPASPSPHSVQTDIDLPLYGAGSSGDVELVIAGAGPAGLVVAERVSRAGYQVVLIDPAPLVNWPNNYGVWVDEFEAMGLEDCLEVVWPSARVFLDSSADGEKSLSRPYGRVDRPKFKRKLLQQCIANGVKFHLAKAESVDHDAGRSTVVCSDGAQIAGCFALDATGHRRQLVQFDKKFDPGYQGAYGIMAEVESHPFDLDTVIFMDWRDDHTEGKPQMRAANDKLPTFLYAMPFSKTKIFLEETSLVARPAVGFQDLKERLEARLAHMRIAVKHIEEEEYCLIPMGGVLPTIPQRVLGIGGTAGMVHPSTGYMVSRMLGAAPELGDAIIEQLCAASDKADQSEAGLGAADEAEAARLTAAVWRRLWPRERLQQREFFSFGMEVLLTLDLRETREFFAAFFSLSDFHWQGFLSARLSFLQLIGFGLSLFVKSSNAARLNLLSKGLPGLVVMLMRLTRIR